MKAKGSLKTFVPTNAFIDVVFVNDKTSFFAEVENGLITDFYEVEVVIEDVDLFDKEYSVSKGDEEFLCFINEKNERVHGFKSVIASTLINMLLTDDDMHLLAKCEIAGELELNGLLEGYLDNHQQEESFTADLEYFLIDDIVDLNNDNSLYTKMVELDKKALEYDIQLDNLIATKNNNIYFGNNKVKIDYFLNQTLNEKLPNIIQSEYKFYCDYDNSIYNILKKNSFTHCIKNSSLYKIAVKKDTDLANKKLNNHLFRWRHLYSSKYNSQFTVSEDEKSYIIEDVNIENQILEIYNTKDLKENYGKKVASEVDIDNLEKEDCEKKLLEMGAKIIEKETS